MCGPKPCSSPTCTWSETFRRSCLARYVATCTPMAFSKYLETYRKVHGVDKAKTVESWATKARG